MLSPLAPFGSLLNKNDSFNPLAKNTNPLTNNHLANIKANKSQAGLINRHDSFSVFNDILQKSYQKMAFNPSTSNQANTARNNPELSSANIGQYQRVAKISSEQAADTILSFISQKLKMDEANGANKEQLLNRLDQGLKGFVKGFNEAKDQITGMGLLTDDLAAEINDTYERVTKGIEELRSGINGEQATQQEISNVANVSRVKLAGEVSQTKSFSLQLTTQDGDKVVIDISKADQASFSSDQISGKTSALNFSQQSHSSSSFNLNVTGHLDEDELTAINQLLQDVDKIAGSFFEGNLDKAFEQALNLEMDRDELSSLNLQLQKTSTVKALAAYESTAQNVPANESSNSVLPLKDLNELFNNIQSLLNEARKFAEPLNLITDVSNGVSGLLNDNNSQHQLTDLANNINALVSKFNL